MKIPSGAQIVSWKIIRLIEIRYSKGIPELDLPVLDPMEVDMMENEYRAGEVMGRFVLRDVKTYGLAKTSFLAVRPKFTSSRMNLEVDIEIPKVFIDGDYKAEGNVGPYKIGGKGEIFSSYYRLYCYTFPWNSLKTLSNKLFETFARNSKKHDKFQIIPFVYLSLRAINASPICFRHNEENI